MDVTKSPGLHASIATTFLRIAPTAPQQYINHPTRLTIPHNRRQSQEMEAEYIVKAIKAWKSDVKGCRSSDGRLYLIEYDVC